jgi:hypothetical protein
MVLITNLEKEYEGSLDEKTSRQCVHGEYKEV